MFVQTIAPVKQEVKTIRYYKTPTQVFEVEDTMLMWNELYLYGFVTREEYSLMRSWLMYKKFNGGSNVRKEI